MAAIQIMLGENRTSPVEQLRLSAYSYDAAWWLDDYGGGDNLSDMAKVEGAIKLPSREAFVSVHNAVLRLAAVLRGLATSNVTAIKQGFQALWSLIAVGNVTAGFQGPQVDWSYHFHGTQLLSASYGLGWASSALAFYAIAAGTQWALPAPLVGVLAPFLAEGDALLDFNGAFDYGTEGRGIDRPGGAAFAWGLPTNQIRTLAQDAAAATWAADLVAFADRIDAVEGVPPIVGSKYFWTSAFFVHHRPTWGASLKMHGNNSYFTVVSNECDNSENLLGQHTGMRDYFSKTEGCLTFAFVAAVRAILAGDGVLNVFTSSEQGAASSAYGNIFPLLDWHALNGISSEADTPIGACSTHTGDTWVTWNTEFWGGATDGSVSRSLF